jgi:hypothetical protein
MGATLAERSILVEEFPAASQRSAHPPTLPRANYRPRALRNTLL